jgi:WD40 repeat protein
MQTESERLRKETADLAVSAVTMTFTGDGKHLVLINAENRMEVFTVEPLQRIGRPIPLEGTVNAIQSIGDHEILLAVKEQPAQRWSIATQWELECTLGVDLPGIISDRVNSLAFNHDGTQLAIGSGIGSRSGHLAILGLGPLHEANLDSGSVSIHFSEPEYHSDTILGLAYTPDGRALASCSADKMIKVMDLESLKIIRVFEGHTHHVLGVAWQNDGVNLATTSSDGTCKIWDFESGETIRTLTVGPELTSLSFIGTSSRFVSTVIDHSLRLHDIESKNQIRQFDAAKNSLYAVSVSPDGRYAIAIGQEGIPRAWQLEDGKLIAEIK